MRIGPPAQLLTMMAKKDRRLAHRLDGRLEFRRGGLLRARVGGAIGLVLDPVPQPKQDTQGIRVEGENRVRSGEEEDLVRAGRADRWEGLQYLPRFEIRPLEEGASVPSNRSMTRTATS